MSVRWHVRQIWIDGRRQLLDCGAPADILSPESQWIDAIDPDTGEKIVRFVGPVFNGRRVEIDLASDEERPTPIAFSVTQADQMGQRCVRACLIEAPGRHEITFDEAGQITLTLTPAD